MADIFTSKTDELIIDQVLQYGFSSAKAPKYTVLRLALAKSMRISTEPDESFDKIDEKGSEYTFPVLTGKNYSEDMDGIRDFDDAICALLSAYHNEDLFSNLKRYRTLLQRHIRRGLYEIKTSWNRSHDFIVYLQEELFAGLDLGSNQQASSTDIDVILVDALKEIGVLAEIKNKIQGPRIDRYFLYLPNIQHFDQLKRGLEKLAFRLGLQQEGVFIHSTSEPKVVSMDIPRSRQNWKTINASQLPKWAEQEKGNDRLAVWLGEDVLGKPFAFDLVDTPHLLIAGTTGSGKSISLHAILLSLLWTQSTENLQLALCDPKQVELAHYENIPHLYGKGVVHLITDVMELLEKLVDEMERRNQLLREAGVSNLTEALQQRKLQLPRIVVVIEELADLMMQSRELETPLVRLAQKARSTGIHLILATQRPDSVTFSGLLRTNIPSRIALRVQKNTESRIILDEMGAEQLLGSGDMLVKIPQVSTNAIRVHGAYISQDDIKLCLRNL
ncbi:FtsK/SpoIIIE domain-containing protein [Methylobacter sp.]|uniref:FtsK/SpoIIIE domain-containing protein n=1 Tax=Methylobacter sp. TaxID=2051955 RepID=UPI002FDC9A61